jgi:hypothetical protein
MLIILGALLEFHLEKTHLNASDRWIREIKVYESGQFFVVLCHQNQAKAFQQASILQIDVSYKMMKGIETLTLSGWNKQHNGK